MQETKLGGKEVSLLARKYFEEVLNTPYLYFEAIKVSFDEPGSVWNLEVEVRPLYATVGKRYKLQIGAEGEVKDVEQIPAATKG